jgi:hypothetical protein
VLSHLIGEELPIISWNKLKFQMDKPDVAIEDELKSRPKRTKSGDYSLTEVSLELEDAIKKKDKVAFNKNFKSMIINCNSSHLKEEVPFVNVKMPVNPFSSIR